MFSVLDLRELLIAKLGVLAGMRPGEIFALDWGSLEREHANIRRGVYRGHIDTPKTHRSVGRAALAEGLRGTIELGRTACVDPPPTAWVFPSETIATPVAKDNVWRRYFKPRLESVGLGWVNFMVMRKTHSCMGDTEDIDPQVRAEQMGHSIDVNQNVYTRSSLDKRIQAVNTIEKALVM